MSAKFSLGQTVITSNAQSRLYQTEVLRSLARHASGDWGIVDREDAKMNNEGLKEGQESRLMSVYLSKRGERFWIITEWDRSVTTILMPEDY